MGEMIKTDQLQLIEQVAADNSLERIEALGHVTAAVKMAGAMVELRKLINGPVLEQVTSLAGSPLGFLTDRDYQPQQLLDPAIECLLRGGRWTGNEFNVIAHRCYMTLQFYERRVAELVNNLQIREEVPQRAENGALVGMHATWLFEGQPMEMHYTKTSEGDYRIAVKVNSGMGTDAILGKARRKLLARIYRTVTGSRWAVSDANADVVDQAPAAELPNGQDREPDDTELLNQAIDLISEAIDITSTKTVLQHYGPHLTERGRQELDQAAAHRIEQIRASRGQRSN